jgi:hypothetical protein
VKGLLGPQHSQNAAKLIKGAQLMMVPAESHLIWFSKYKLEIENKIADFISN